MIWRKFIGKLTSPIFVPLRKFVIWMDNKLGTCEYKLSLEPRWESEEEIENVNKDDNKISELMQKVSKDKAALADWGDN